MWQTVTWMIRLGIIPSSVIKDDKIKAEFVENTSFDLLRQQLYDRQRAMKKANNLRIRQNRRNQSKQQATEVLISTVQSPKQIPKQPPEQTQTPIAQPVISPKTETYSSLDPHSVDFMRQLLDVVSKEKADNQQPKNWLVKSKNNGKIITVKMRFD
jgi:hypothetical protein